MNKKKKKTLYARREEGVNEGSNIHKPYKSKPFLNNIKI